MTKRLALVAALFFVAVAAASVLIPSSPDGVKCGSIVSPDWTDEQSDELIDGYRDLYEKAGSSDFGGFGSEAVSRASVIRSNNRDCEDARGTRKIVAGSAAGLALVVPAGLLFVTAGRKREDA